MGSNVIGLWTSSFRGNTIEKTVSNYSSTYTADKVIRNVSLDNTYIAKKFFVM